MTYEFRLPDIGEGVVEGEVVRWLVNEGDRVREDQPLVEIMTDKATVEIPAPRAGRIGKRMYAEGQICPVGKVLITIETDDAADSDSAATDRSTSRNSTDSGTSTGVTGTNAATTTAAATATTGDGGYDAAHAAAVLATPATRKLARDLGVDIRQVHPSGPAGRITSEDVKGHGRARPTTDARADVVQSTANTGGPAAGVPPRTMSAPGDVRIPFRGVRKKIAERLVHSKHTAAHFTYVEEIDCTELVKVRAEANRRLADRGVKLSYLPFIIKATVAALQRFPQLNATLDEAAGEIVQRRAHHIGLATATDSGLIVPVIRDAGSRTLVGLAAEIDRLAEATRTGQATRDELSGSTFTITSLGLLGGLLATPIINFPEVAILGVHKIAKRPAVIDDQIVARDLMNLSISVDHRVVDGYDAARLVADIKGSLEKPGAFLTDLA